MRNVVVEPSAPGVVATEWEQLAARADASPFLRPGWFRAWWSSFGTGRFWVLTLRRGSGGRLAGVLPLRSRFGRVWSPTNWHSAEFGWLAEDDEAGRELLAWMLDRRCRRVTEAFLSADDAASLERHARERNYHVTSRVLQRSPYLLLDAGWHAYEQVLDKKLRSELRRRRRRLEEQGEVSYEVLRGGKGLDAALYEGFRVEAAGWKGRRGSAIVSQAGSRQFYRDVACWAAARGWLRLGFLRVRARAVAFDLSIETDEAHYLLKTGFDEAYRQFAPGKLMRHEMLRRAFEAGLSRYEFLGHEAPWKLEWTRSSHSRWLVQLFLRSPAGLLERSVYRHGRPVAKRLYSFARSARRRGAR